MLNKDEIKSNQFFTKKNLNFLTCIIIIFTIFFFDRVTKIKVLKEYTDTQVYINDFLNIDLIWNTGIGFGLLSSNSTYIYNSITILISLIVIFLIYLIIKSKFFEQILFCFVLGGALGNLYDRSVYHAVPDFIDFHYKSFHWFTFNIADIFITIGILMLILKSFFENEKSK